MMSPVSPGQATWTATFSPELSGAGRARHRVRRVLAAAGVADKDLERVAIVVGELVGNAVRHAQTQFTVTVTLGAGGLRLEVFDRDTRPPSLRGRDDESTSGRGLQMISALAADWGWQSGADADGVAGKAVWAELQLGHRAFGGPDGS